MSCVYKIREGMASYTDTEKKLADYILQHASQVTLNSAQILGEKVGVSAAAVIRFAHKLGYSGFTAMKVDLARDTTDDIMNFDDMINEHDTMAMVVKKAENLNTMLQNQAYRLLNIESLERAVNVLLNSRTIYLFGVSGSGNVCTDFMEKLSRINRHVVYHKDFHDQFASAAHMTPQDAALAVSYSGKTHEVNTAMQFAKESGAATIAITQFKKTPLTKLADVLLYIPTTERELRLGAIASRNASLIVTDLLYLGIAKNDIEKTKESLVKTKEVVKRLK
ncbi:MurR/RpiR family transcriptional regulator [Caproiciproducens galactitolivorans]|uniref:Putative HTH-type transcriptional regulator YbbH n=1 Tax=Caproiciproducens galactitolivorans TaxID=642589 RepID=A0A4Z0Y9R1_9FIRM|nr:MurR/RpiR family transcriptional regulator [Caproiciproducens galactitolivorans]QEY35079.1 MurR/RpiR family transcriptional regulator [Caproiciproducens galactitolivorans]TGJ76698.1 putative HTH-type transcriptional regulator YbbH [Caproiciproducens galactitolivorans]